MVISIGKGCIEGVFRSREPMWRSADGTPCFDLFRFYLDGMALYVSLRMDPEENWDKVEKWFNREAAKADVLLSTGFGQYQMEGNHIRFSTPQYDRNCDLLVEYEHSVEGIGDHLWIQTTVTGHPFPDGHEFVPLRAAQG